MANHLRRQIRDAFVTALTGLATTGTKVYAGRVYAMQDANLPGLRIYTNDEENEIASLGVSRTLQRRLQVVVEACFKDATSLDNTGDQILKEVETALGPGVALGGAKHAHLAGVEIERDGEGEKPAAVLRMTFECLYYTAHGTPDVAL